jgi:hypothetical protein
MNPALSRARRGIPGRATCPTNPSFDQFGKLESDIAFVMPTHSLVGENLTSVMPTLKVAMLPLSAETGRHIRNDDESQSKVEAVKHQVPNPVAEVVEHRNPTYAMLPLGRETGMHIRDLNEENKEPAKSVAASGSKTTA